MSIAIRFACGHLGAASESGDVVPVCRCGETRIQRVTARAPRFRGACTGPYAESGPAEPAIVNVAPSGPLVLKAQE